jgi:hypothetical protein
VLLAIVALPMVGAAGAVVTEDVEFDAPLVAVAFVAVTEKV